jgi:hypothetical protein
MKMENGSLVKVNEKTGLTKKGIKFIEKELETNGRTSKTSNQKSCGKENY